MSNRVPNPYDYPEVWGELKLSGVDIGLIVSVDGAKRPYDWAVQKALGTSGAATLYRGELIAEGIKIVVAAPSAEEFERLTDMRAYIAPKNRKQKPPVFDVENGFLNWNDIVKVSIHEIGQPDDGSSLNWHVESTFIEYAKAVPVPTGPGDPAKAGNPPSPADEAERKMAELLAEIDKV